MQDVVATPLEDDAFAVLLSLENNGPPDRLMAVSSPWAEAVLYNPAQVDGLPIPTGSASLALDGAHIRLSSVSQPMEDGVLLPLTLTYANAGAMNVKARLSDPAQAGRAGDVGLFGLGDICLVGEGEPAPRLSLRVTPAAEGWRVRIDAEEFTFSKDFMGLYHVPGVGHGHIYVDGMKLGRVFAPEYDIGALPKGRHEVRVTLNTNDHRAYVVGEVPVTASAVIVVD